MERLTITKKNFLDWYYDYGQDTENAQLREDLAKSIINQMRRVGFGTISVRELFDNCNQSSIRYCFTEECQDDNDDRELGDIFEFTIELI